MEIKERIPWRGRDFYHNKLNKFLEPIVKIYVDEKFKAHIESVENEIEISRLDHKKGELYENLIKKVVVEEEKCLFGEIKTEAIFGVYTFTNHLIKYIYGGQLFPGFAGSSKPNQNLIIDDKLLKRMTDANTNVMNYLKPYVK